MVLPTMHVKRFLNNNNNTCNLIWRQSCTCQDQVRINSLNPNTNFEQADCSSFKKSLLRCQILECLRGMLRCLYI
jgi:hypothetical protein